jgi:hypothetical protein
MAFESKREPGKKFGSVYQQRRFDSYGATEQPAGKESNEKAESQDTGTEKRAAHVHYSHDHDGGKHKVTKTHEDGSQTTSEYNSAAEAYEAGGTEQATDVKKRTHPDQQGAESEERNYEMPDLV